jgi:tRNA(fMet)-specific endonuclease VapC
VEDRRVMLDTSAFSAFFAGEPEVVEALGRAEEIALNPVVLGELLAGFAAGSREKKNRERLREFLSSPRVRVLPLDEESSERYATIYHHLRERGTPIPTNDLWIAASAMQHGLALFTRDRHFSRVPQIIARVF